MTSGTIPLQNIPRVVLPEPVSPPEAKASVQVEAHTAVLAAVKERKPMTEALQKTPLVNAWLASSRDSPSEANRGNESLKRGTMDFSVLQTRVANEVGLDTTLLDATILGAVGQCCI